MGPIFVKVGAERINLNSIAWVQETVQANGGLKVIVWSAGGQEFVLHGDDATAFLNRLDAIERSDKL